MVLARRNFNYSREMEGRQASTVSTVLGIPNEASGVMNYAETKMRGCKSTFTWTINDFAVCAKMRMTIESPLFSSNGNDDYKWSLKLNVCDKSDWGGGYFVQLKLCPTSEKFNEIRAIHFECRIASEATNPNPGPTIKFDTDYSKNNDIGWKTLMSSQNLASLDRFLYDGKLILVCNVIGYLQPVSSIALETAIPECNIVEKIGNLLDTEKFSDVTLVVGGREIRAHKAILAAQSSVLSAMFERELEESKRNRADITDVDAEVFREMLRFMYTGKTAKLEEMTLDLLAAADKYDLGRLKAMCEVAMLNNITIDNCTDILIFADLHESDYLKRITMNFIISNLSRVMETERYASFAKSYPNLVLQLISQGMTKMQPKKKLRVK